MYVDDVLRDDLLAGNSDATPDALRYDRSTGSVLSDDSMRELDDMLSVKRFVWIIDESCCDIHLSLQPL